MIAINPALITPTCRNIGAAFMIAGLAISTAGIVHTGEYPGKLYMLRYQAYLDRTIVLLFLKRSSRNIIRGQLAAIALFIIAFIAMQEPAILLGIPFAMIVPWLQLEQERKARHTKFEEQADGFVLALANSLKAVPSIGGAIQGVMPVIQDPVRQEMALVLNELRLGNTIEQALLNATARAESASLDSAISALLVGRQVGGNLPKILETTAYCIREMNRLDGVLKSKTAEGRAQMWVLALFPAFIVGGFRMVKPDYFDPLRYTQIGQIVTAIAVGLWITALLIARNISNLDL